MNFQEGMRRVGMALGLLGAVAILPHTYKVYEDFKRDHDYLTRFVNFSQSAEVQKAVKVALSQGKISQSVPVSAAGMTGVYLDSNGDILWVETPAGPIYKQRKFPFYVPVLFIILLPLVCFVVPWGMMKGVTWVLSGFLGKH